MDNWKSRSSKMKCHSCMFFVSKEAELSDKKSDKEPFLRDLALKPRIGRCRRHSPTMKGYPAVFAMDWCGDHKLDENKI